MLAAMVHAPVDTKTGVDGALALIDKEEKMRSKLP
jgi:hypothetical protein